MVHYDHLPIFQKVYVLTLEIYKVTGNFKREYKYTLGEKMKLICNELLDLIVKVNSIKDKVELLNKLDFKLESLRINLRLAFDLKALGGGKLGELNEQIEEVGKQIGGWQKWAEKK